MTIDDIILNLQQIEAAAPVPAKKKKASTPAVKTNGATQLTPDEQLAMAAARIAAALHLDQNGVTAADLVAGVKKFEAQYEGAVQ